eukprot:TRINITY_DN2858_c0_g1_i1.p1 TRINITY_DN2858_c0_g1~~TRINITY_DN2858_c0_g1_i1.p1  ORF type:complete len:353 (+),score=80.60 TRINITY_DN2858_c0_g1_i1:58-1116(+)
MSTGGMKMRSSAIYGISYKARCIAPQQGDCEKNRFFVGTLSLREKNQIHHIEEENSEIKRLAIYDHPNEMWDLSSCPYDSSLLFSVSNAVSEYKATLLKVNEQDVKLEEKAQLGKHEGSIKCVLWHPGDDKSSVVSLDETHIRFWDLENPKQEKTHVKVGDVQRLTAGVWNTYFTEQVVTCCGLDIISWDSKSNKAAFTIAGAHGQFVRSVDINSNNPYYLVSGGDDSKVKFWDWRNTKQPVLQFTNHSHWVTCVRYNKLKDSLVLSASTDSLVNLYSAASIAFQNPSMDGDSKMKYKRDEQIRTYDDHEDSVYTVCWSNSEHPWSFASLSYDGRVVINRVPQNEVDQFLMK